MEQFAHLPEFRVIICQKCQHAVLPSEIDTYFQKTPVHGLSKKSREYIIRRVQMISGLIQSQEQLQQDGFVFPLPSSPAIPELGEPRRDGIACNFTEPCLFVNRRVQLVREHGQQVHQWDQVKKKGRPSEGDEARQKPWREGVHCQRFFDHGLYSGYFEVRSEAVVASTETPEAKAKKLIQDRIDQVKERERKTIEVTDPA